MTVHGRGVGGCTVIDEYELCVCVCRVHGCECVDEKRFSCFVTRMFSECHLGFRNFITFLQSKRCNNLFSNRCVRSRTAAADVIATCEAASRSKTEHYRAHSFGAVYVSVCVCVCNRKHCTNHKYIRHTAQHFVCTFFRSFRCAKQKLENSLLHVEYEIRIG